MATGVARKTYTVILQKDGLRSWNVVVAPIMEPSSQVQLAGPFKTMRLARMETEKILPDVVWARGNKGYTIVETLNDGTF